MRLKFFKFNLITLVLVVLVPIIFIFLIKYGEILYPSTSLPTRKYIALEMAIDLRLNQVSKILLKRGAPSLPNPEIFSQHSEAGVGGTLMDRAVMDNNLEVVKELIAYGGVEKNECCPCPNALKIAISNKNVEIARALIEAGASLLSKCGEESIESISIAAQSHEIVELVRAHNK